MVTYCPSLVQCTVTLNGCLYGRNVIETLLFRKLHIATDDLLNWVKNCIWFTSRHYNYKQSLAAVLSQNNNYFIHFRFTVLLFCRIKQK